MTAKILLSIYFHINWLWSVITYVHIHRKHYSSTHFIFLFLIKLEYEMLILSVSTCTNDCTLQHIGIEWLFEHHSSCQKRHLSGSLPLVKFRWDVVLSPLHSHTTRKDVEVFLFCLFIYFTESITFKVNNFHDLKLDH